MKLKRLPATIGLLALVPLAATAVTACSSGGATSSAPQAAKTLILSADTVMSGTCVLSNQFKAGDTITFRIKVYDPTTGQTMDDKALKNVSIGFGSQKLDAAYSGHPGGASATPTDHFWAYCWKVPAGYPTGALNYQITATANDGRTGTFSEFNVAPSLVTITQ